MSRTLKNSAKSVVNEAPVCKSDSVTETSTDTAFHDFPFYKAYTLNFCKSRIVNSPEKSNLTDAGIDFYVPTDLHITDFTKNFKIYFNENVSMEHGYLSPRFDLKNINDGRELSIAFDVDDSGMINYYNVSKNYIKIDPSFNVWIESAETVVTKIVLASNEKILLPSGIYVNLPPYVFLDGQNKSGIASKRGLYIGAATIDEGYQGEILINLTNVGNKNTVIKAGEKIVQFIPHFRPYFNDFKEFSSVEDLYKEKVTDRGIGGFGSTSITDKDIIITK